MDRKLLIWAAGFFDGEGCISIAKPVNFGRKGGRARRYIGFQLQAIVAQRDRRPMEVLVGLFGGNITAAKIHGSTYWYLRLHGPKAAAMLKRLAPFLILKKEQAKLAIQFQDFYDGTRPYRRAVGRSEEEVATLYMFYEQSKAFNLRYKHKDYTESEKGGVTHLLQ